MAVEYRRLTAHTTRVPKRHVCIISGILVQRRERRFPSRSPSPHASLARAPRSCPRSGPGPSSRFCLSSGPSPSSRSCPRSGPGSDSRAGPRFSQSPSPYPLTRISRPFFPATTPAPPFSSLPSIARLDSRPRPLSPATVHGPCCRARARAPRSSRALPCPALASRAAPTSHAALPLCLHSRRMLHPRRDLAAMVPLPSRDHARAGTVACAIAHAAHAAHALRTLPG